MFDEEARPAHESEYGEPDHAEPSGSDESTDSERRRRPVADWGGDDLFNQVPRRRFTRTGPATHVRRPSPSPITSHQLRRNADVASLHGFDGRGGDVGDDAPGDARATAGPPVVTVFEPDAGIATRMEDARATRDRRRPRRTVDQRLGARPDRVAAWAFMLGLMLILLAVGTADAAALPLP